MTKRLSWAFGVLLLLCVSVRAEPLSFSVTFPNEKLAEPFTGRVVVFLARGTQQPRFGPNWFRPEPMYARDFVNVAPGEPMVIDDANAIAFPGPMRELQPGEYAVQAVVDRNLGGRTIGRSPGNLYSKPVRLNLDPASSGPIKLVCDQVVEGPQFRETDAVKLVKLESTLLSRHYQRPTFVYAAVTLPPEYDKDPDRRFPVIYTISGFGGSIWGHSGRNTRRGTVRAGEQFIVVDIDANCPTGHCVFADSANNGPWGAAVVNELIPEIDKRFRTIADPAARLLTGHSSGGWSSLWLQVTYPDMFGGTWSTSPDPVDFRAFQTINIYDDDNAFVDPAGGRRPVARRNGEPALFMREFVAMERPVRGEQMGSFDAVFSPRAPNGQPEPLYDLQTGKVNRAVADAWKSYDIGLILRENWNTLGPKLAGRIHVYMGNEDTFYLDAAVRLLKKDLADLGSDAVVELVPGDHGSMMTPDLQERIALEMAAQIRKTGLVQDAPATLPSR